MSSEASAQSEPDAWYRHPWFRQWGGYILAALGAFMFASKGIWIKLAYQYHTDASSLLTLRLAPGDAILHHGCGLLTWWRARPRGRRPCRPSAPSPCCTWKAMGVGVLGYWLASYTDFEGLTTLSPQFERLILFTYPLFSSSCSARPFFGQALRVSALWTFTIAYAGLALVFVTDLRAHGSAIAIAPCGAWYRPWPLPCTFCWPSR